MKILGIAIALAAALSPAAAQTPAAAPMTAAATTAVAPAAAKPAGPTEVIPTPGIGMPDSGTRNPHRNPRMAAYVHKRRAPARWGTGAGALRNAGPLGLGTWRSGPVQRGEADRSGGYSPAGVPVRPRLRARSAGLSL